MANKSKEEYAIRTNNLVYSYSSHNRVLDKCRVNVPKGEIYALLGSSGCGKTTLINCIIGRLRPHSGHIQTFGIPANLLTRNKLGYMPQDISLFTDFTIEQNLRYFARINGMSDEKITAKISEFLELLNLPNKARVVSQLSGGQQRRVSLSVAIIHSPMLVILDEPTVGVDPVVRNDIWKYLEMICAKNSVTVMITTHYLEEARNASTVAYLRDGQIIAEQNPDVLLIKYNCNKLEDVFLQLCETKQIEIKEIKHDIRNINGNENTRKPSNFGGKFTHVRALFRKDLINQWRGNRGVTLFLILLPTISLLIAYMTIIKKDIKFSLSAYNEQIGYNSSLSSDYINSFNSKVVEKHIQSSHSAVISSVIDGKVKVGIIIPQTFSKYVKQTFAIDSNDNSISTANASIKVYVELIELLDVLIIPELQQTYIKVVQNYLSSNGLNPSIAEPPFQRTYLYETYNKSLFDFAIPAFLIFSIFTPILSMTGQANIKEKEEGVLQRSIIAGVNSLSYHFALLCVRFISVALHIIIFMTILYPVIHESKTTNIFLLFALLFTTGLCGVTFGFLFAAVISTTVSAIVIVWWYLLLLIFIGGCIWPLEALPQFVQSVSPYILPVILPTKSMTGILFRGWSLDNYLVWIGFLSNILYSLIFFTSAVIYSHLKLFRLY